MKKIQGSHVPGGLQCFCLDVGFPRLRNKTPPKKLMGVRLPCPTKINNELYFFLIQVYMTP